VFVRNLSSYSLADSGVLAVGDIVESDVRLVRGDPGTEAIIKIIRHGQHLVFTLKQDKICIMGNGNDP